MNYSEEYQKIADAQNKEIAAICLNCEPGRICKRGNCSFFQEESRKIRDKFKIERDNLKKKQKRLEAAKAKKIKSKKEKLR